MRKVPVLLACLLALAVTATPARCATPIVYFGLGASLFPPLTPAYYAAPSYYAVQPATAFYAPHALYQPAYVYPTAPAIMSIPAASAPTVDLQRQIEALTRALDAHATTMRALESRLKEPPVAATPKMQLVPNGP